MFMKSTISTIVLYSHTKVHATTNTFFKLVFPFHIIAQLFLIDTFLKIKLFQFGRRNWCRINDDGKNIFSLMLFKHFFCEKWR